MSVSVAAHRLGDVAEFVRGINFKPEDVVSVGTAGSIACLRTKNVQDELDVSDVWAVSGDFVKRQEQFVQRGDILVSSANSWNLVGKCCWVPDLPWRTSFGGFISVLRCNKSRVDARYLYHWFSSEPIQNRVRSLGNQTTNISNLSFERCLALELPLPTLPEQRRIAVIMDQAEALRAKRMLALEKLDLMLSSLFSTAMSMERGLKWLTLEDSVETIIDYRGKSPVKTSSGIPLITARIVKSGRLLVPNEFIAESDYDQWMRRGLPKKEDVLFTSEAPLGEVAQLDEKKVALAQRLLVLRGRAGLLNNTYLRFVLTWSDVRRDIESRATGSTVRGIRQSELRKVKIPLISFRAQEQFAHRVSQIERIRTASEASLAKTETLLLSLQQRAFRGEL